MAMAARARRDAPGTSTRARDLLLHGVAVAAAVGNAAFLALPLAVDGWRRPVATEADVRAAAASRELAACVDGLEVLMRTRPPAGVEADHRREVDAWVTLCREARARLGAAVADARTAP